MNAFSGAQNPGDQSYDDRSHRGNQQRRRLVPSEASQHVIFLGLDPDFTEGDVGFPPLLRNGLPDYSHVAPTLPPVCGLFTR